jgi:hypothetical protein
MNWTEIEAKWAAMTRRVKTDLPMGDDNMSVSPEPEQAPAMQEEATELRAPLPLDRPST